MNTRKLPIGIQSFDKLRQNNYLYIDKTGYIKELVTDGEIYFLSRPRRFGKSLFVTTLEAYFRGRKDLFHGLEIEEYENSRGSDAWKEYPVITFMLSGGDFNAEDGLADILNGVIETTANQYGLNGKYSISGSTLPGRFKSLIEQLYANTGGPVVVLVDEYDKPLLETMLTNPVQEEKNRQLYKSFFSVLKDEDSHLKFVFFTGVTKFSKVSIFSDLNQLRDISLSNDYSGICGITEEELKKCFLPEIEAMASYQHMTTQECLCRLARMYDGYHFSPDAAGVYNPYSLLNAFADKMFRTYWFETATPTFLIRQLQNSSFTAEDLTDGIEAEESGIMNFRADNPDPIPLFYQSGYLTICGYDREFALYNLRFPNDEVRYGFLKELLPYVVGNRDAENPVSVRNMVLDLRNGKIDSFLDRLSSLFAGIPYPEGKTPEYEQLWSSQIYLILALLGQNVKCEVHSAGGRADCIAETDRYVYIFEFKVDKSAREALQQIEDRGYADPYRADRRKVWKVGVNFSSEKRNIDEWEIA